MFWVSCCNHCIVSTAGSSVPISPKELCSGPQNKVCWTLSPVPGPGWGVGGQDLQSWRGARLDWPPQGPVLLAPGVDESRPRRRS